jgi:nucleoside-diphosphate-sugar epimerase
VLPALLRRFHEAKLSGQKQLIVWGTGTPRREFLHVDDMADASLFVLDLDQHIYLSNTLPMQSHVNVGSGEDIAIADLAKVLARVTGYSGEILFDHSKPDGTPIRLLDVTLINSLGWKSKINLERGIEDTYAWYMDRTKNAFGIRHSIG